MERGKTGEAHRVETASDGRGGSMILRCRLLGQSGHRTKLLAWLGPTRLTQSGHCLGRNPAPQQSAAIPVVCYPFDRAREVLGGETARLHHAAWWHVGDLAAHRARPTDEGGDYRIARHG